MEKNNIGRNFFEKGPNMAHISHVASAGLEPTPVTAVR